jgi:hypothetical protein
MKHFLIVTTVLIFSLAVIFSSCKKRYMCECTYPYPGDSTKTYVVDNPYDKKLSKSQAATKKTECEATPNCEMLRNKHKNQK